MSTIRELANAVGAGARGNKYRITFAYPAGVQGVTNFETIDVLAKSGSAPGKELGAIELYNQGRKISIPGETTYDGAWTVGFYLTENHALRLDMLKWMDACDSFQTNRHSGNPGAIFADLRLEQLDSAGEVSATYTLHNCYPSTVAEIAYTDDAADAIAEFDCTFTYSDWVVGIGETSVFDPINVTENDIA